MENKKEVFAVFDVTVVELMMAAGALTSFTPT